MIEDYFDFRHGKVRCFDFIDPKKELKDQVDILREDMGYIEYQSGKYVIDYGWKPDFDITGEFIVYVIEDGNWCSPLREFRSKKISEFMHSINQSIDLITKLISHSKTGASGNSEK